MSFYYNSDLSRGITFLPKALIPLKKISTFKLNLGYSFHDKNDIYSIFSIIGKLESLSQLEYKFEGIALGTLGMKHLS